MFLLKSMALMVEISNSWVNGLPTIKFFVTSFSGEYPNFWTRIFRWKGYYKKSMSGDQKVSMSGGQLSVFLKSDS